LGARFAIKARGASLAEFVVIKLMMLAVLVGLSSSLGVNLRSMELMHAHAPVLAYVFAIVFIAATLVWDIVAALRSYS